MFFLLDTKPLCHSGKLNNGPACKRDHLPRHRPTCKYPLCRFEATCQLLYPSVGSNRVACSCTWRRFPSFETSIRTVKEIPAVNKSQWLYASGVCNVTGKSKWILHCWLIIRISAKSGILLSDLNDLTFFPIHHLNHPRTDAVILTSTSTQPGQYNHAWLILYKWEQLLETTCVGRLLCPVGHVSSLNKCYPVQSTVHIW